MYIMHAYVCTSVYVHIYALCIYICMCFYVSVCREIKTWQLSINKKSLINQFRMGFLGIWE